MIIKIDALLKENLRGKIIVFPTDTVYGIGCLFDDIEMIDRIYQLKARDYSKPMAVLAHDLDQLAPLVQMNDCFIKLAKRHWPGALTLIGKKTEQVSYLATANLETVGVRIPDHQIALKILEHFGPMVTTSLNQTGEEAIYKLEDALMYLDKVDFLIPGGNLKQLASTVYDTLRLQVLRQGDVVI